MKQGCSVVCPLKLLRMLSVGDIGSLGVSSPDGEVAVAGWMVEGSEGSAVLGTLPSLAVGLEHKLTEKSSKHEVSFLRVPLAEVHSEFPSDWKGPRAGDLPPFEACKSLWEKAAAASLGSSDAAPSAKRPKGAQRRARASPLTADLKGLGRLFANDPDADDEDEEDEDGEDDWMGFLPPGKTTARVKKEKGIKEEGKDPDLRQLLRAGMARGKDMNQLLPVMMMSLLLDKDKKGKKKEKARSSNDLLGGSSSDDSGDDAGWRGKGMKAVSTLHKLHEQIHRKPKKVCQLFEKEVIEEMGVIPGQAWTIRDYVKKQPWGKFKGIFRCAIQDAAVYEMLRRGDSDIAAAQVVQNLKSKIQSVIQHGDWQAAWLLCGLPDPLARREFAGSKEELAVVSGYLEALANLRKKVRENQGAAGADAEEDPTSTQK